MRPGHETLRRGRTLPACGGCRLWSQAGRRSQRRKLQAQEGVDGQVTSGQVTSNQVRKREKKEDEKKKEGK